MHNSTTRDLFDFDFTEAPSPDEEECKQSTQSSCKAAGGKRRPDLTAIERENERFLTDVAVAERYRVSRQTVWRWAKQMAEFPAPVNLSPGTSRWRLSDLLHFETLLPHRTPNTDH